jgi:hypothetical protein
VKTATRCVALSIAVMGICQAQTTYPPASYPQQTTGQYQPFQPQEPAHPMRALFAQSLAQVVQTGGSAAVVAVADGLTGALKSWFDNKRQRKGQNGALGNGYYAGPAQTAMTTSSYPQTPPTSSSYPQTQYPATDTYPPTDGSAPGNGGYPDPTSNPNYPSSSYPGTGTPDNSYPQPGGYPQTGSYPQAGSYPQPNYPPSSPPAPTQVYAGIAYEIHLLQPDGSTQPVDIASYSFRTGDQFRVYYRPSLPGRVDVFNINAAGQNAQIDSSVVAAGELASLGPYQFTDLQGEETLILKLSPCVTPQLYATTRSIVKVQGTGNGPMDSSPMGMGDCSSTATRGLKTKTRDIRKVSVEGGTSFALDPIAPTELDGGGLAPRQVTINLHHR